MYSDPDGHDDMHNQTVWNEYYRYKKLLREASNDTNTYGSGKQQALALYENKISELEKNYGYILHSEKVATPTKSKSDVKVDQGFGKVQDFLSQMNKDKNSYSNQDISKAVDQFQYMLKNNSYSNLKKPKDQEEAVSMYASPQGTNTVKDKGLWQFNVKPAQNTDNIIGTVSASLETVAEGLEKGVSDSMRNQPRPNNIPVRVWNNNIESEISKFSSKTGKLVKGTKIAGYAGLTLGTGIGIYENVQEGAPTKKIISDAAVDTAFGLGGLGASAGTGALIGSVIPGAGTLVGAAGGFVVGLVYMGVTEIWEPYGKSIKDRAKEGLYNSIK